MTLTSAGSGSLGMNGTKYPCLSCPTVTLRPEISLFILVVDMSSGPSAGEGTQIGMMVAGTATAHTDWH